MSNYRKIGSKVESKMFATPLFEELWRRNVEPDVFAFPILVFKTNTREATRAQSYTYRKIGFQEE